MISLSSEFSVFASTIDFQLQVNLHDAPTRCQHRLVLFFLYICLQFSLYVYFQRVSVKSLFEVKLVFEELLCNFPDNLFLLFQLLFALHLFWYVLVVLMFKDAFREIFDTYRSVGSNKATKNFLLQCLYIYMNISSCM